jgi:hypothetical protein
VGIDGYQSPSVEQIGIEADDSGGSTTYYAWYEMYPSGSVQIQNLAISPGDNITASVVYSGGAYDLTLTDNTTTKSFSISQAASNMQRSSAEWVVEAPSSGSGVILPLANFGTVAFTNASATINGVTGPINDSAWQSTAIDMASNGGASEATTSALATGGAGFTVTYVSSGGSSSQGGGGFGGGGGLGGWFHTNVPIQSAMSSKPSTSQSLVASQQAARDQLFGSDFDFFPTRRRSFFVD